MLRRTDRGGALGGGVRESAAENDGNAPGTLAHRIRIGMDSYQPPLINIVWIAARKPKVPHMACVKSAAHTLAVRFRPLSCPCGNIGPDSSLDNPRECLQRFSRTEWLNLKYRNSVSVPEAQARIT